jgi:putative ABC transport system substrate-binding protein
MLVLQPNSGRSRIDGVGSSYPRTFFTEELIMKWATIRCVTLLIGALLILAACGGDQKAENKSHTVGIIDPNPAGVEVVNDFKAEMSARGYTEGQSITYVSAANIPELTAQVSKDELDLLVCMGGTFAGSPTNTFTQVKEFAAGKVPVVVVPGSGDPLKDTSVESISHPGKNVTGLILLNTDGKRFDLFLKMLPDSAKSVAVIYDSSNVSAVEALPEIQAIAEQSGIELETYATVGIEPETTDQAFAAISDDVDGVFLLKVWGTSGRWFQWAFDHGIPTSQDGRFDMVGLAQPLMTYGPSSLQLGQRAASFADQILKGTQPGGLPLEYTEPILTVDLGIAEAMNFHVPDEIVTLANVILNSDPSVYFAAPVEQTAENVTFAEGSGACTARQVTMGGTFTVCIDAPCDSLLDSGMIKYTDRADVGGCAPEDLVGTCSTAAFDISYYSGDIAALKLGCGFQSGAWTDLQG